MLKKLRQLNPLRKINNAPTPSKDAKNKCAVASNVTNNFQQSRKGGRYENRSSDQSIIGSKERRNIA